MKQPVTSVCSTAKKDSRKACTCRPNLIHTTQWHLLTCLEKKLFQNIVGKGENAGNKHFLLFPQSFLLYQRQKLSCMLHLSSANAFNLNKLKIFVVWEWVNYNTVEYGIKQEINDLRCRLILTSDCNVSKIFLRCFFWKPLFCLCYL